MYYLLTIYIDDKKFIINICSDSREWKVTSRIPNSPRATSVRPSSRRFRAKVSSRERAAEPVHLTREEDARDKIRAKSTLLWRSRKMRKRMGVCIPSHLRAASLSECVPTRYARFTHRTRTQIMALVRVVYIYMRVTRSLATAAAVTKIEFLSKECSIRITTTHKLAGRAVNIT